MIHAYALGRGSREYGNRTACVSGAVRLTFRELEQRVGKLAATLRARGFVPGDRLALLLPDGIEYIELISACSGLGVAAVPLNTRLSIVEIDRVLADAQPRGLIRHSSLPAPTAAVPWHVVIDREPLPPQGGSHHAPDPIDDADATLALIYTSGTTGHP